jgi:hypothetical protein
MSVEGEENPALTCVLQASGPNTHWHTVIFLKAKGKEHTGMCVFHFFAAVFLGNSRHTHYCPLTVLARPTTAVHVT